MFRLFLMLFAVYSSGALASGVFSASNYNPSAVTITGGTINGVNVTDHQSVAAITAIAAGDATTKANAAQAAAISTAAGDATTKANAAQAAALAGSIKYSSTSGNINLTVGSTSATTYAHGLGVIPKIVILEYINITSEGGYSIGDVVTGGDFELSTAQGVNTVLDATNVTILQHVGSYTLANKSTGALYTINAANWKFRIKVFN